MYTYELVRVPEPFNKRGFISSIDKNVEYFKSEYRILPEPQNLSEVLEYIEAFIYFGLHVQDIPKKVFHSLYLLNKSNRTRAFLNRVRVCWTPEIYVEDQNMLYLYLCFKFNIRPMMRSYYTYKNKKHYLNDCFTTENMKILHMAILKYLPKNCMNDFVRIYICKLMNIPCIFHAYKDWKKDKLNWAPLMCLHSSIILSDYREEEDKMAFATWFKDTFCPMHPFESFF